MNNMHQNYYFMFSLIAVIGAIFYLVNLVLMRTKGKTAFGISATPGTKEYKNGVSFANNRHITVVALLLVTFIANLIYDTYKIIHNDEASSGTLVVIACFVALLFGLGLPIIRWQVKGLKYQQTKKGK